MRIFKKNLLVVISMFAVLLLAVFVSGCITAPAKFDGAGVTFSYPSSYKVINQSNDTSGSSNLIFSAEKDDAQFTVTVYNVNGTSLEAWKKISLNTTAELGGTSSVNETTVNGVKAYQITEKLVTQKNLLTMFEKNGKIYEINFLVPLSISNSKNISDFQSDINTIINSFQVK